MKPMRTRSRVVWKWVILTFFLVYLPLAICDLALLGLGAPAWRALLIGTGIGLVFSTPLIVIIYRLLHNWPLPFVPPVGEGKRYCGYVNGITKEQCTNEATRTLPYDNAEIHDGTAYLCEYHLGIIIGYTLDERTNEQEC